MANARETLISNFNKLYAANVLANTITVPVPQASAPRGSGIINPLMDSVGAAFDLALFAFFGVGTSGQTATARITAWRQTQDGSLWIPSALLTLNLTLGTQVGIANTAIGETNKLVSAITAATAFTSANEIISPGADGAMGLVAVDPKGAALLEVDLAIGNCTSINALWAGM
jgi:hypothetical protein